MFCLGLTTALSRALVIIHRARDQAIRKSALEQIPVNRNTTRRTRFRSGHRTRLRAQGQRLLAVPSVPIVIQTSTTFIRDIHVHARFRVETSHRTFTALVGVLVHFKDFPFTLIQSESSFATRIKGLGRHSIETARDEGTQRVAVSEPSSSNVGKILIRLRGETNQKDQESSHFETGRNKGRLHGSDGCLRCLKQPLSAREIMEKRGSFFWNILASISIDVSALGTFCHHRSVAVL